MPKRIDCFVLYSAQKELPTVKMTVEHNSLLKFFMNVKSLAEFKALELPIVQTVAIK